MLYTCCLFVSSEILKCRSLKWLLDHPVNDYVILIVKNSSSSSGSSSSSTSSSSTTTYNNNDNYNSDTTNRYVNRIMFILCMHVVKPCTYTE